MTSWESCTTLTRTRRSNAGFGRLRKFVRDLIRIIKSETEKRQDCMLIQVDKQCGCWPAFLAPKHNHLKICDFIEHAECVGKSVSEISKSRRSLPGLCNLRSEEYSKPRCSRILNIQSSATARRNVKRASRSATRFSTANITARKTATSTTRRCSLRSCFTSNQNRGIISVQFTKIN